MTLGPLARAALWGADQFYRRPLLRLAKAPRRAQERALRRILAANAGTAFGRDHGFSELRSLDAFRAAVPTQTHETLAEAIAAQAETGRPTLTAAAPVYYARTSGTTGPARNFPMTAAGLRTQRWAQKVLAATLARDTTFFEGEIAGFSGARVEGALPSGQPFGSASGQGRASAPAFFRSRFVTPDAAFAAEDVARRQLLYAVSSAASGRLTGMITANPSTLLSLAAFMRRNAETLLRGLADGVDDVLGPTDAERRRAVEQALARDDLFAALWPRLGAVATWTGGNCRVALSELRPMLGPDVVVAEIGYRASEFIGTINVDARDNACVPDIAHTVFEFVEEAAWEGDRAAARFLWVDELTPGRRYYVFATTQCGLYRYDINDVVEAGAALGGAPTLNFVRKGQGVTSITGEKLSEAQAIDAVTAAYGALGRAPGFFILVADASAARYRLFCETAAAPSEADGAALAAAVDAELSARNVEYAAKRSSTRLQPVTAAFLRPGAQEAARRAAVAAGQRESQLKTPALVDAARWRVDFAPFEWT